MYLQFARNVASVGDYGVHRNAQMLGYLLVTHALYERHDDVFLAFAQCVGAFLILAYHAGNLSRYIALARFILKTLDGWDEDFVLHFGMQRQPLLIIIYIVERGRKLIVAKAVAGGST